MFSIDELRLIRHAVSKELEQIEKKIKILDPDSDESVELGNDSVLLRIIIEKINETKGV